MVVDYEADAWLAGFAAGEASFGINRKYGKNGELVAAGKRYYPVFSIALRADDIGILRTLQSQFGGAVSVREGASSQRPGAKPRADWTVYAKADLERLLRYFERFPLRAKKAADCAVWCEAVRAYLREGSAAPELAMLRAEMVGGRLYAADLTVIEGAA